MVEQGGAFDRWDLEARGGLFGSARARFAVEDHGPAQYVRARVSPSSPAWSLALLATLTLLCGLALADGAMVAGAILGAGAGVLGLTMLRESGGALAAVGHALHDLGDTTGRDALQEPAERLDAAVQRQGDG